MTVFKISLSLATCSFTSFSEPSLIEVFLTSLFFSAFNCEASRMSNSVLSILLSDFNFSFNAAIIDFRLSPLVKNIISCLSFSAFIFCCASFTGKSIDKLLAIFLVSFSLGVDLSSSFLAVKDSSSSFILPSIRFSVPTSFNEKFPVFERSFFISFMKFSIFIFASSSLMLSVSCKNLENFPSLNFRNSLNM